MSHAFNLSIIIFALVLFQATSLSIRSDKDIIPEVRRVIEEQLNVPYNEVIALSANL
jgi:hypothetical protein